MRGGVLLGIGAVLMLVALGVVGAVAVYTLRLDEQAAYTPPAEPAEPAPVEELERKNVPMPEREKAVVPRDITETPPLQPGASPPEPAADTRTLVAVRTCDGTQLQLNAAEKEMYDLHNETRAKFGLGSLCVSAGLTNAARIHSRDMLNRGYFSHDSPEGMDAEDRAERLGFPIGEAYGVGENISLGDDMGGDGSPGERFRSLMNSPGHRANILEGDYQEIGIGVVRGRYTNDDYGYDDTPATVYTIDFGLSY